MRQRGFTIIELAIVMAIMAILLTLGTLGFRSYMAHARDKEREADIAAIQNYLESIYPREIRHSNGTILKSAGTYPGYFGTSPSPVTQAYFNELFKDVAASAKKGPQQDEELISPHQGITFGGWRRIYGKNDIDAIIANYNNSKITGRPNGAYVYFAHNNGVACKALEGCREYLLLYHLETEPNVWKVVEGKHK
ncbi:MAG: prepilin-type N-terminal cleavage/methylation domain-containing protein [Candidatus Saccharibacteria bacterium]|nr:prepilin-type N-terminal cleavage/methylation domain-containing protein [Candidatus Saccharibacteria bacterium]